LTEDDNLVARVVGVDGHELIARRVEDVPALARLAHDAVADVEDAADL
jgi:hypothetical protein